MSRAVKGTVGPCRLYSYRDPRRARTTLAELRQAFPNHQFEIVPSPRAGDFRFVIRATAPDGKGGYVAKGRIGR